MLLQERLDVSCKRCNAYDVLVQLKEQFSQRTEAFVRERLAERVDEQLDSRSKNCIARFLE